MSIAPSHLTISKTGLSRLADEILRGAGVSDLRLNPEVLLPRSGDLEQAVISRKEVLEGKAVQALLRSPKTRPEGNISQMFHPLRGQMQQKGSLNALNHPELVDETISLLTSEPIKPHFGYERTVSKKGPFPFVLGGFDPSLDYNSSFLRPVIADDPEATKQLYDAVRKRITGVSTGKYGYTVDELRGVVEELKPVRDSLRYELMVGGLSPRAADPVTINRAVRAAVMLNSVATIPGSSDLSAVGLHRRSPGGRIYDGTKKGARGVPAAALDLMAGNMILAAVEGRKMPIAQRAIATYVFQNMLGPSAGFRTGRDAARQPGMPNLPVMPLTEAQAAAMAKNIRELELFESNPTVRKAVAALSDEDLLDRTEQALDKRFGSDKMIEMRNEMSEIARDRGRPWTDKSRAMHMMQKARAELTEDDFLKLGEEVAQVPAKPPRTPPAATREVRGQRGGGFNTNMLTKKVRDTASELGLRVRNPVMVAAIAGMLIMGLTMARDQREAA